MSSFKKYLNPIFKDLTNIENFKDFKPSNTLEAEEFPPFIYLEKLVVATIKTLLWRMEELEKEIELQIEIIENETGNDKSEAVGIYNQLLKRINLLISRINRELDIADIPYFGRITIAKKESNVNNEKEITSYIGKFAYFDQETKKVLITDWRAPIANLYYTNSGPAKNVVYKTPSGEVKGDLKVKRQFDISAGRIKSIYDTKSGNVSADEFLLKQLNRRLGKKLTDIVATIQQQQNDIIRSEINKPIILQGVAGSGKTTIVLHRLAYLFFAYPKEILPQKSLIVAPNRMFLDYISDVLPSLGIEGVESNTFIFWAKKILGMDDSYSLFNETKIAYKQIKGSSEFLLRLENFFEDYEKKVLNDLPYSEYQQVAEKYYELKNKNPEISTIERIELALNSTYVSILLKSKINREIKEVSETTKEKIEQYVKNSFDIKKIYFEFLSTLNDKMLFDYTKKSLGKHSFTQEDLPPLLWISFTLNGYSEHIKDYIVVDEAQDMSPFELYILSKVSKKNNIFLAGDIAQAIVPPFQIPNWKIVMDTIESRTNSKFNYYQLNKCYRTTVEIIKYSNSILKKVFPKEYVLPQAVLRHGQDVTILEKDTKLEEIINKQFKLGSASVAIITKDEAYALNLYSKMKKNSKKFDRQITTFSDSDYKMGILVLPVNKAKGLEFDSVFLHKKGFDLKNELDARQFYVAVTRALHRLYIINDE